MKLLRFEPSVPNFGDDLNTQLWPTLVPTLFEGAGTHESVVAEDSEAFVGIGTIVGIDPGHATRLEVFSSGAGYTKAARWRNLDVRYHCVRGPLTARVLGLDADRALTDGAILAPLCPAFRQDRRAATGAVVVVPHYETICFPGWSEAAALAGYELVDPRGTPEDVIAALASARLVLTESLHGAILADAFGVPWRGFAVSRNFSTAKWADWAASLALHADIVMVPPPDPMPLLRFGKRAEPFGARLSLDPESALREFHGRVGQAKSVPYLKVQAKRLLEAVPAARRLLRFSPERTARALVLLAERDPYCSAQTRRVSIREEMLDRLDALARAHGGGLVVQTIADTPQAVD
jgi:succinoglycan biosynthesis protein ExoV